MTNSAPTRSAEQSFCAYNTCHDVINKLEKNCNPPTNDICTARALARQAVGLGDARSLRRFLVASRADRNAASAIDERRGWRVCLLHLAAFEGSLDTVLLLLAAGASVNAQDLDGWTPLHYAARNELHAEALVRTLVAAGARIDKSDNRGRTALHVAYLCRNFQAASELLDQGASAGARDIHGRTPVQMLQLDKPTRRRPWSGSAAVVSGIHGSSTLRPRSPRIDRPCTAKATGGLPQDILTRRESLTTAGERVFHELAGSLSTVGDDAPLASVSLSKSGDGAVAVSPDVAHSSCFSLEEASETWQQPSLRGPGRASHPGSSPIRPTSANGRSVGDCLPETWYSSGDGGDGGGDGSGVDQLHIHAEDSLQTTVVIDATGTTTTPTITECWRCGNAIATSAISTNGGFVGDIRDDHGGQAQEKQEGKTAGNDKDRGGGGGGDGGDDAGGAGINCASKYSTSCSLQQRRQEQIQQQQAQQQSDPAAIYRIAPEGVCEGTREVTTMGGGKVRRTHVSIDDAKFQPICPTDSPAEWATRRHRAKSSSSRGSAFGANSAATRGYGRVRREGNRKLMFPRSGNRQQQWSRGGIKKMRGVGGFATNTSAASRRGRRVSRRGKFPRVMLDPDNEIPDYVAGQRRWMWAKHAAKIAAERDAGAVKRREACRSPRRLKMEAMAAAASVAAEEQKRENERRKRAWSKSLGWGVDGRRKVPLRPASSPAALSCNTPGDPFASDEPPPYGWRSCVKCDEGLWDGQECLGRWRKADGRVFAGGPERRADSWHGTFAESYRLCRLWMAYSPTDQTELWWAKGRCLGAAEGKDNGNSSVVVKRPGKNGRSSSNERWAGFAREWGTLKYLQEEGWLTGRAPLSVRLVAAFERERTLVLSIPAGSRTLREIGARIHAAVDKKTTKRTGTRSERFHDQVEFLAFQACRAVCWLHRCGLISGDVTPYNFVAPPPTGGGNGSSDNSTTRILRDTGGFGGRKQQGGDQEGCKWHKGMAGELRIVTTRSVARRPEEAGGCPKHPLLQFVGNDFPQGQRFDAVYAPPERVAAASTGVPCPATAAVDAWGLGMTLYWLLTGREYAGDGSTQQGGGLANHGTTAISSSSPSFSKKYTRERMESGSNDGRRAREDGSLRGNGDIDGGRGDGRTGERDRNRQRRVTRVTPAKEEGGAGEWSGSPATLEGIDLGPGVMCSFVPGLLSPDPAVRTKALARAEEQISCVRAWSAVRRKHGRLQQRTKPVPSAAWRPNSAPVQASSGMLLRRRVSPIKWNGADGSAAATTSGKAYSGSARSLCRSNSRSPRRNDAKGSDVAAGIMATEQLAAGECGCSIVRARAKTLNALAESSMMLDPTEAVRCPLLLSISYCQGGKNEGRDDSHGTGEDPDRAIASPAKDQSSTTPMPRDVGISDDLSGGTGPTTVVLGARLRFAKCSDLSRGVGPVVLVSDVEAFLENYNPLLLAAPEGELHHRLEQQPKSKVPTPVGKGQIHDPANGAETAVAVSTPSPKERASANTTEISSGAVAAVTTEALTGKQGVEEKNNRQEDYEDEKGEEEDVIEEGKEHEEEDWLRAYPGGLGVYLRAVKCLFEGEEDGATNTFDGSLRTMDTPEGSRHSTLRSPLQGDDAVVLQQYQHHHQRDQPQRQQPQQQQGGSGVARSGSPMTHASQLPARLTFRGHVGALGNSIRIPGGGTATPLLPTSPPHPGSGLAQTAGDQVDKDAARGGDAHHSIATTSAAPERRSVPNTTDTGAQTGDSPPLGRKSSPNASQATGGSFASDEKNLYTTNDTETKRWRKKKKNNRVAPLGSGVGESSCNSDTSSTASDRSGSTRQDDHRHAVTPIEAGALNKSEAVGEPRGGSSLVVDCRQPPAEAMAAAKDIDSDGVATTKEQKKRGVLFGGNCGCILM